MNQNIKATSVGYSWPKKRDVECNCSPISILCISVLYCVFFIYYNTHWFIIDFTFLNLYFTLLQTGQQVFKTILESCYSDSTSHKS